MIAFDLRMYEYILLFFQFFVGFKIFHSKLREGRKGKGSLDFWYIVHWYDGHRFIFSPKRDPLPPKAVLSRP